MKSLQILVMVLCASTMAAAGDREFHGVVRAIETTYGVHHTRIPLLGVALFFARPAGVSGVKLAVIEGFPMPADAADVSRVIESALGPDWHPFVRVVSKGETNGETTLVYAYPEGGRMRILVADVEPSETVIVEVKVSDRSIKKWLKEPGEEADNQVGHHHHSDN